MASEALRQSWAITLRHLAASRYYLPTQLDGAALDASSQMEEFLHQNEFGLALGEAEALGELCQAPDVFWEELRLAAENMGSSDKVARLAARRSQSS